MVADNPASMYGRGAAVLYEMLPEHLKVSFVFVLEDLDQRAQENGRQQGYFDAKEERLHGDS